MSAIDHYFFSPLYSPRSTWSVIGWWESRRLFYNLAIGVTGLFTLAVIRLAGARVPLAFLAEMALVYGLMANVSYTLGPAVDLLLRWTLGPRAAPAGPVLFRYGFVFSLGLTLMPAPLTALGRILYYMI